MPALEEYTEWMNAHLGFNPRSQANSNALSNFVVADLRRASREIDAALQSGKLAAKLNADVYTRVASRNVDLVLRENAAENQSAHIVHAAIENKTIMTAHGKARWNRYGDVIAYCNHIHNHSRDCIAGAIVVINCSPAYENPDGFAKGLIRPRFDMQKVVRDTVKIFSNIPLRNESDEPNDQPEAVAVIVVDYDGLHPAKLVTGELAPQPENPIHYDGFVQRICKLYSRRFGKQEE